MERRRGYPGAVALVAALGVWVVLPAAASAATTCTGAALPILVVSMNADEDRARIVRSGNNIQVFDDNGAVACTSTAPTLSNTTTISVSDATAGQYTFFEIDLAGGPFLKNGGPDEIDFTYNPGAEADGSVQISGSAGPDNVRAGKTGVNSGVNLNGDNDLDVTTVGVPADFHLEGGPGDDQLSTLGTTPEFSGFGIDGAALNGEDGNDVLRAGGTVGSNEVRGGAGNDQLLGASAVGDFIYPGDGDDYADGGGGSTADTVVYTFPSAPSGVHVDLGVTGPQATGGSGTETIVGVEIVWGSDFDDVLIGTDGINTLTGEQGSDTVIGRGGKDNLIGGPGAGTDLVSYAIPPAGATTGVSVILNFPGYQNTGGAGEDQISSMEGIIGSPFTDTLTGDANANTMRIRDGRLDTVTCLGGADTVEADLTGVDTINADCETKLFDVRPETAITQGPDKLSRTRTPTFTFASSEANSTFRCAFDGGAPASCPATFKAAPLAQGPHRLTVNAVDEYGNADLSPVTASFSVDSITPKLSKVSFRKGKVRLTLSEPAAITVALERKAKGRRSKGRCSPKAKKGKRCTVYVKAKSKKAKGKKGKNTIAFSTGRLKAGTTYRLSVTAKDPAGNVTKPKRLGLALRR